MELSINENIVNKGDPRTPGWKNSKLSVDKLIEHIVKYGFAWSPGILSEAVGNKKPAVSDIKGAILLAVDIDNSIKSHDKETGKYNDRVKTLSEGYLSFDTACSDPWLQENALFVYETPSSSEECNRFRIVFLMNSIINDPEEYSQIASAFIEKFGADKSCKNIDRFFFGFKGAKYKKFSEIPLRPKILDSVLKALDEEEEVITEYKNQGQNRDLTPEQVAEILKYIDGNSLSYDEWFRILSAIGNYFDESTAINLIEDWSPDKTLGTAYKIQHRASKPVIGSVVYYAKRAGFDTKAFYKSLPKKKKSGGKSTNGLVDDHRPDIDLPDDCIFWAEASATIKPQTYKLVIIIQKYINFLNYLGFRKYWNNPSYSIFVYLKDNIVGETTPEIIRDIVTDYILSMPNVISDNFTNLDLQEKILSRIYLFNSVDLLKTLKTLPDNFISDSQDNMFFYFKNYYIKVTKAGPEKFDYSTLNGYIWKDQINDRNIELYPVDEALDTDFCVFSRFISCICSLPNPEAPTDKKSRLFDLPRFYAFISALGYLLHTYKSPALSKAIIFCEEKISSNDESNGRSGKGLTSVALGYLRKRTVIPGKSCNFRDRFIYQEVTNSTQLLSFEDVRKDFNFEALFNVITEGLYVEKKNKTAFTIPFDKSPKVIVSTNYVMPNDSDSFKARKFELEFSDYFTADYTPVDEFGTMLFEKGWAADSPEWDKFYTFLFACCAFYLENGLVPYEPLNLKERKLLAGIPEEFIEFAYDILSDVKTGDKIDKNEIFKLFTDRNKYYASGSKFAIPQRKTTKWFSDIMKLKNISATDIRLGTKDDRKLYWQID
jgi:hypothetical protein